MTLFSLAGSLNYASHTQPPESGSERKTSDTCGPKCAESFERFNHVGLWAKTFSALLIGTGDWYSTRCKLTWKLKGTKYNRLYFQLQASTLPTKGTGFGLLHTEQQHLLKTPTAMDGEVTSGKKNPVSGNSGTLAQEIMSGYKPTMEKLGLLLTPTTREEVVDLDKFKKRMEKYPNGTTMPNLATQVLGMLPTPTTMDMLPPKTDKAWEKEMTETRPGRTMPSNLRDVPFRTGLLPTPIASDIHHAERVQKLKESGAETMASRKNGANRPNGLMDYLDFNQMLPTPRARAAGGNCSNDRGKGNLEDKIAEMNTSQTGTTSQLSPHFVLELMGFPPNFTELPFLNGETNQSRPPETPSCPK